MRRRRPPPPIPPRDIRVLRRAKELLAEGLTYERTRCQLAEEGLFEWAEPESADGGPTSNTERERAERYVRNIFERFVESDRANVGALLACIDELVRRVAELTTRVGTAEHILASARRSAVQVEQSPADGEDTARARRGWPFR